MPSSTLTPDNLPAGRDRSVLKGHGTFALGPSDSSDSGSDLQGLAGHEIGDSELDSDSDRNGNGESAAAEGDTEVEDGADIGTDRVEYIPEADLDDEDPRK